MLQVTQVNELTNGFIQTSDAKSLQNEVKGGISCDLLSWVMAKGREACVWVTVQTHMNVIAVAALHDMACVILPEGLKMGQAELAKADEEGIAVISSPLSAFQICGILYEHGIKTTE